MRTLSVLLALSLLTLSVRDASAQDVAAAPTYGDIEISEGFTPDPVAKALTAGGTIEVDVAECGYGHVADAPDVDLYYETSGSSSLYIFVQSDEDTTLLINLPDGSWVCDDDSLGGSNPMVIVPNAGPGLYDIWVGTYGSETVPAALLISEIDPLAAAR